MEEFLKQIWASDPKLKDTGTFEQFKEAMANPDARKSIYEYSEGIKSIGTYDQFNEAYTAFATKQQPEKKNLLSQAGEVISNIFGGTGKASDASQYTPEELDEVATKYGYKKLTEDKVQEWVDKAAEDPTGTAWGSGVQSLYAGLTQSFEETAKEPRYADPRISPGGGYIPLSEGQREQESQDQAETSEARKARKLLQEQGYFTDLTEKAIQRQILSNQKWRNSLQRQGLDPDATMREAFKEKGLVKGLQYVGSLVAQQAPQVVGAIGVGALTKNPQLVGTVLGASAAGGDMLSTIMDKRALTEKDVLAAWAKGAVEGSAEALFSPAVTLGQKALTNVGGRLAKEIIAEGGVKGAKSVLKKALKAGAGEGGEEVGVELIGNLIDTIKENEPDWDVEDFIRSNNEKFDTDALLETFVAGALTGAPMAAVAEITRKPDPNANVAASEEGETPQGERQEITEEERALLQEDADIQILMDEVRDEVIEDPALYVTEYLDNLEGETLERLRDKADKLEDAIDANNKKLEDADSTQPTEPEAQEETETPEEAPVEREGGEQAVGEDAATLPETVSPDVNIDRLLTEAPQEVQDDTDTDVATMDGKDTDVPTTVESFETAKGSVYTVLPNGKVQRFKTATNEQHEPSDLIVFVKFKDSLEEQEFLAAQNRRDGKKLSVIDSDGNVYDTNEQVKGKDVRLAIIKDGKVVKTVETSTTPKVGYNTFDQRRFKKEGVSFRNTHLGNKVTKITSKKAEAPTMDDSATTLPETVSPDVNIDKLLTETPQEGESTVKPVAENVPEVGGVSSMATSDIEMDPDRFQFKDVKDKERGVSDKMEGRSYQSELAGTVAVWVDPQDGKTYVVNGHHRLDLAKQKGVESVNVLRIDAKDAAEARKKGALINMAEGQGSAIDAAKVFRESVDPETEMKDYGLSMRDKVAAEGLALSKLTDSIFNLVTSGKIKKNVGVIIGSNIADPDLQEEFYRTVKGKGYTQGQLQIMAQDIASADSQAVESSDLFGTTEKQQANFAKRAKFVSNVRRMMSRQKNLLGKVARGKDFLEQFGNEIDKEMSEGVSKESAQALAIFDRYRNLYPSINQIINDGFKQIQEGASERKVAAAVTQKLTEEIPSIIGKESRIREAERKVASKGDGTLAFSAANLDEINDVVNELDPKGKTDLREVPRIAKVFKQFFDKPVFIHRTTKDARIWLEKYKAMKGIEGSINENTAAWYQGDSIHIIASKAGQASAKHEFMHTMVGTILLNDPNTFEVMFDDMLSMPEFQESGLMEEINELYDGESEATKQEEMMVEFLARVGAGQIRLSPPSKNKVVQLIRNLMNAIGFNLNDVSADFREFAREVADAMRDGREIKNAYRERGNSIKYQKDYSKSNPFKAWAGNAIFSKNLAKDAKTGKPIVAKLYHGTTHDFSIFNASAYGTNEGYFGAVNYFTNDFHDAKDNYGGIGPDLENKIQREAEAVAENLWDGEYDLDYEDEFNRMVEDYGLEGLVEFDGHDVDNIARMIAEKRYYGGKDKVMEVYVKLNNPLVVQDGQKGDWWEPIQLDDYEHEIEDAAIEVMEEYDITEEEAKEDYEYEITERAIENAGVENPLIEALQSAIDEYTIDGHRISAVEILGEMMYEKEININELESNLRSALDNEHLMGEDGELVSSHVLAMTFKNLGFDGIILKNADKKFPSMNMGKATVHVHVFDEYNNQIKLADGTNTTFNSGSDIRFQKNNPKNKIKRKHLHEPFHIVVKSLRGQKFDPKKAQILTANAPRGIKKAVRRYAKTGKKQDAHKALRAMNDFWKGTHPEIRKEDFNQMTTAVDKVLDVLEGKAEIKDAREAIKQINVGKIDKRRFKDKMYRYRSGKFSDKQEQQQMYHFIEEVNEYFEDPVRSEATDVAVQAKVVAPNFKFQKTRRDRRIESFIKSKDKVRSDTDIAITLINVFGMTQDQAILAIEQTMKRNYQPQMTQQRKNVRSIYHRVLTPFRSVYEFVRDRELPIKVNGDNVTFADFGTYLDTLYADKIAGVRKIETYIKDTMRQALPDELRASERLDQATSKAAFYREQLITNLFGAKQGDYVGYRKYGKNSIIAKMRADGVTWAAINRFAFMQHAPEFLRRKQDLIQQRISKIQRDINDVQTQLSNGTGNRVNLLNKLNGTDGLYVQLQEQQNNLVLNIGKDINGDRITAAYAEQVVRDMIAENPRIEHWAEEVRKMLLEERHNNMSQFGLASQERLDALRAGTSQNSSVDFDFYVPMKVDESLLDKKSQAYNSAVDKINDLGIHKLDGSTGGEYGFMERHSPLTQLLADVLASREIGEHNSAMRSVANLLTRFKSNDFTVRYSREKHTTNEWGQVDTTEVMEKKKPGDPDTRGGIPFIADNGRKAYIIAKNESLANSTLFRGLKNADPVAKDLVLNLAQKILNPIMNFFRSSITSLSLVFGFNQLAPDFIDASVNLNVDMEEKGVTGFMRRKKLQAKLANNWQKSMRFLVSPYRYKSGLDMDLTNTDPNTMTMKDFWLEAQQNGMPMSWRKVNYQFEEGYKELADLASDAEKFALRTNMKTLFKGAFNTLSNMNDAMENVNRLAAYMTARKEGLSPQRATQIGKDVTINFERKGVKDGWMRSLYLFWGAAVNGAKRSGKTMRALGVKGAASVIGMAAVNRMMMYAFFEEDELNNMIQSEYSNRNRVIITIPGTGRHLDVKSPYSFMRIYYAMGKGAVDVSQGKRTLGDVWFDMTDAFYTAFAPISGNASWTNYAPTIIQPLVQVKFNRDYKDDPIVSESQNLFKYKEVDKYKESTEEHEGTDEFFVQVFQRIYETTGFDYSPAYAEYLFDAYLYKPAIRETLGSIDQIPRMLGGQKISDSVAEALGFEITDREFDMWGKDAAKILPPVKAFYRPTDQELQSLWNFYSFVDRPKMKGLTDEQASFIVDAYKVIYKEKLADPRAIESVMRLLKDKYPEKEKYWRKTEDIKRIYK